MVEIIVSINCDACSKLAWSGKHDAGTGKDCQRCTQKRQSFLSSCAPGEESQFLHTKLKRRAFTCEICGMVTKYIARHRRSHLNVFPYTCGLCNKQFKFKDLLDSHLVSHSTVCKYKCDVCEKPFKRKFGLRRHMYIHTGNIRPVDERCKICHRYYQGCFQTHAEKFHVGPDTGHHKCMVCDRLFPKPYMLKNHMTIHTGNRPYLCEMCGKTFPTTAILSMHRRIHDEKVPCRQCGKPFLKEKLVVHMKFHSEERPYQCEICGKMFKAFSNLCTHLKCHSEKRPHACEVCDSRFKLPHQLRAHIKRHSKGT